MGAHKGSKTELKARYNNQRAFIRGRKTLDYMKGDIKLRETRRYKSTIPITMKRILEVI